MSDVRVYAVVPSSLFTPNYERTGGHMVFLSLKDVRASLSRYSHASKIIWSVAPEEIIFSDSRGSCIRSDVAQWKDLHEEDLHVFKIEETMSGPRARDLSLDFTCTCGAKGAPLVGKFKRICKACGRSDHG